MNYNVKNFRLNFAICLVVSAHLQKMDHDINSRGLFSLYDFYKVMFSFKC